ncbi:MAG: oligosaccharide flippase family protein [Sedimentisphaerales bacterium]|nr:oligosaccharide flippase family protein [Sedimentisphaerales bacterium]
MEDLSQEINFKQSSGALRKIVSDKISRLKGTDIKAKSIRAVMALGAGTFAGRSMRFIRSMILARILAPKQIGLMAIVMSVITISEALIEVGVKQSVIQNKKGASAEYLNVAWWMQVVRGLLLFGIAFILAPWISSFYGKPELLNLLRVAFIAIMLRGFMSPRAHVLEKEYKFGRVVLLIQGSAVLGAIISVGLALLMRNVWALVIGFVIEMAILCILSFILVPFVPRFEIDRNSLIELLKFARGMFGLPILTAFSFQAPILVLGKVISEDQLGLYSYAAILSHIPVDLYIRTIAPVVLPVFSEKQDDKSALCRGILRTTQWTACFFVPIVAFMACCASGLLLLAYGPKYVAMAVPFAILCLEIVAQNQAVSLAGLYMAVGQPHLQRRFAVIRALTIIGLMYPVAALFGPIGAAFVIVFCNIAVLFMQVLKAREVINLNLSRYIRTYVPGLLMALPNIMTAGLLWIFGVDSPLLVLTISALVLIVTFAVSVFLMSRPKSTLQSQQKL